MMDKERLEELAAELAKGVKSESDLVSPLGQLMKLTIEKALNAELDNHLGYEKHSKKSNNNQNSRNGRIGLVILNPKSFKKGSAGF